MALNQEEFKSKLNAVLENVSDPGKVSEILTELHQNYNDVLGETTNLTTLNGKLKESNDSLILANGKLFLSVGLVKEEPEKMPEPPTAATAPELKSIDDVMDELLPKWGIK